MTFSNLPGVVALIFLQLTGIPATPSLLRRSTAQGQKSHLLSQEDALRRGVSRQDGKSEALVGDNSHPARASPRVFLLFLVKDGIGSAEHWRSFLDGAPAPSWRVLVHCKHPSACRSSPSFKLLPEITMVETVNSWYCHDLVSAMVQLLREATSEAGTPEDKFVFISDSTLPVKPPLEIHSALMEHPESDICIFPSREWAHAQVNGTKEVTLVRHHQWVVLNREHATQMVKEWSPVHADGRWSVPLQRGTRYAGDFWSAPAYAERGPNARSCNDEWAVYATLFGVPVTGRRAAPVAPVNVPGLSGSPLYLNGNQSQGTCRTFAFFEGRGQAFKELGARLGFFMANEVSCWPWCKGRPMSFKRLSDQAVLAMRESPFLFARKFVPGSVTPGSFQKIILSKAPPKLPLPSDNPPLAAPAVAIPKAQEVKANSLAAFWAASGM